MVGRLTLDQVVKVRILAPQLTKSPAMREKYSSKRSQVSWSGGRCRGSSVTIPGMTRRRAGSGATTTRRLERVRGAKPSSCFILADEGYGATHPDGGHGRAVASLARVGH